MATNKQLIQAEFRFSSDAEMEVIKSILLQGGIDDIAYYDGTIEADVPGNVIEEMKKRNILMDIVAEKIDIPAFLETGTLKNFGLSDEIQEWQANAFKVLAQKSYLNSGEIFIREEPTDPEQIGKEQIDEILYLIIFAKPFDTNIRSEFKEYRIELYAVPDKSNLYSYISCLNRKQYKFIRSLQFVVSIDRYQADQKLVPGFLTQWTAVEAFPELPATWQLYDITVLSNRHVEKVISMPIPGSYGVIIDWGANTIRVATYPGSLLFPLLANVPYVTSIAPYIPPSLFCDVCRDTVGLRFASPSRSFFGDSEIVAVIDSGIDISHTDLKHRIKTAIQYGTGLKQDRVGHGTHVAGIICGDGTASGGKIVGIAPAAQVVSIGVLDTENKLVLPADIGVLLQLAVDQGATIINLSWGYKLSGEYQQGSFSVDQFIYDHPEVMVIVAAGNEGNTKLKQLAYRTLGVPGSAKNVLTVGAASSQRTEPLINETWGQRKPANFPDSPMNAELIVPGQQRHSIIGSTGPTDYDSIKPEVVAPGTYILSAKASDSLIAVASPEYYDYNYTFKTGTSMAAPVVSGIAAVLREFLRLEHACPNPTSSLLKAIIIGSSDRIQTCRKAPDDPSLDEIGFPDFDQGFGMVNMGGLLNTGQVKLGFADVRNNDSKALESRAPLGGTTNSYREYMLEVTEEGTGLSITLCWIDLPARGIQNNLQLSIKKPDNNWEIGNSDHFYKKSALFDVVNSFNLKPHDKFNTTEKVLILNAPLGNYVIRITAQNTISSKQGYGLAVLGSIANFRERP